MTLPQDLPFRAVPDLGRVDCRGRDCCRDCESGLIISHQRRTEMTVQSKPEPPTLLSALALALPELEGAKKTAENPAFKRDGKFIKYADLGSVIDAIRPVAEHGVWFIQMTHENEGGAEVETIFIGHGEQFSAGRVFVPAIKRDAHGFGSALTYARRYGLQTAFGLSSEDDDGNAAVADAHGHGEATQDELGRHVSE